MPKQKPDRGRIKPESIVKVKMAFAALPVNAEWLRLKSEETGRSMSTIVNDLLSEAVTGNIKLKVKGDLYQ